MPYFHNSKSLFYFILLVLRINFNLLSENYYSKPDSVYKMKPWGLLDIDSNTINNSALLQYFTWSQKTASSS